MPNSKTRLLHTCPTERPFYCITGDLSGEGFLVVVDKSTHELLVQEGAEAGTVSVIVNPKGLQVKGVSVRPGTRMLDLGASPSDPLRQAAESLGRFPGRRRGRILYALGLRDGGPVTLTVFDDDGAASAELSDPMVEQLIEQLRSRSR